MSKYNRVGVPQRMKPRNAGVHPIWRGIGCLLIVIVPLMAYAGSVLLVRENFRQRWIALPAELVQFFDLPGLGRVYYADLVMTIILMVAGLGVIYVLYSFVYSLIGPPRYGPLDAPPSKRKARRLR